MASSRVGAGAADAPPKLKRPTPVEEVAGKPPDKPPEGAPLMAPKRPPPNAGGAAAGAAGAGASSVEGSGGITAPNEKGAAAGGGGMDCAAVAASTGASAVCAVAAPPMLTLEALGVCHLENE